MKLIRREDYLKKLRHLFGTPDIKVLTGIRRSGKSKLLEALKEEIKKHNSSANIIHINFNLLENEELLEKHALHDYIKSHYVSGTENFVLIDEVQMCPEFEKVINSLHASEQFDIYITGSNAFLLSSDLATLFTGRTFSLEIYPFSFKEYVQYFACQNIHQGFNDYMRIGGMSGLYPLVATDRDSYLREVFQALIVRDITDKYKIRNELALRKTINFLMDNIGNLASINSIVNKLNSAGETISNKTLANYIECLCRAFCFYKVRRYDIRGKKYLNTSEKYYLADVGFRYAELGSKDLDYGRVLENIVAIELKRRGYEIYVGMLYKKEIDFVVMKGDEKFYIQVAAYVDNPETLRRELEPLLAIHDAYPKIILCKTGLPEYQQDGVRIIDIATWLISVAM